MEFLIKGRNLNYWLNKEDISIYHAFRKSFLFNTTTIEVVDNENNTVAEIIDKVNLFFTKKIEIGLHDEKYNSTINFKRNIFSNTIIIPYKNHIYKFISQRGITKSIFKDDKQVGFYKRDFLEFSDHQFMKLILNKNEEENLLFIFAIIMVLDGRLNSDGDEMLTINSNFLFTNKVPFDRDWRPE